MTENDKILAELDKIYGYIVANLEDFRILSEDATPPEGQENEFKTARQLMASAEIAVNNTPCFGGGGGNACPPLPESYC